MMETGEPQIPHQHAPSSVEPLVVLSDAAATKLQELTAAEQDPRIGLRVYVYSGGCSGFRYGMMLEDQPTPEDVTVESKGIKVYVDSQSTQYLSGSEIDYVDALMGAGFAINNPNVQAACGCGSSFQAKEGVAEGEPTETYAGANGCGSGCAH